MKLLHHESIPNIKLCIQKVKTNYLISKHLFNGKGKEIYHRCKKRQEGTTISSHENHVRNTKKSLEA